MTKEKKSLRRFGESFAEGIKEGRKQLAEEIIPRLDTLYNLVLDLESKLSYHVNISDHKQEFRKWVLNIKEKLQKEVEQ